MAARPNSSLCRHSEKKKKKNCFYVTLLRYCMYNEHKKGKKKRGRERGNLRKKLTNEVLEKSIGYHSVQKAQACSNGRFHVMIPLCGRTTNIPSVLASIIDICGKNRQNKLGTRSICSIICADVVRVSVT